MFDEYLPKHKIGCLSPLAVVENSAYEFYRLAPRGLMLVLIPVGLSEFSRADVERVFAPLDKYLDMLKDRGVDVVMQNGVPLPLLIGIEAHDRMIEHMAKYSGCRRPRPFWRLAARRGSLGSSDWCWSTNGRTR